MKAGRPIDQHGFSLVEVLVALIVMSVGLLGIAKMQAVALSSTSVASQRSLAALEAAGLAAAMHANRGFWGTPAAAQKFEVKGGTVAPMPGTFADCLVVATCAPAVMATYDLQHWATSLQTEALLPNYDATIDCTAITTPRSCKITITWSEKSVALNSNGVNQAEDTASAINVPDYELYVEP
jgi:type IV pilus assembly protein PilV